MENTIICGDALTELHKLSSESVHCCITSPPYWGLRDYGVGGQLGLEKTPEEYVAKMVKVFREVKRVLRRDGTLWLNLGDSYTTGGQGGHQTIKPGERLPGSFHGHRPRQHDRIPRSIAPPGLKPKDLVGIPWRVAFALQADGWYLRSDIIWAKANPMPESVSGSRWERHRIKINSSGKWIDCPGCPKCTPNDGLVLRMSAGRPTKSHEYIFELTKSDSYFFDQETVKELANYPEGNGRENKPRGSFHGKYDNGKMPGSFRAIRNYRNIRSVWAMATNPFKEAHFATFPPELPERCIKAGTPEKGVCPKCGAPWVRIIKPSEEYAKLLGKGYYDHLYDLERGMSQEKRTPRVSADYRTLGWRSSCACNAGNPIPAVVLDPFFGAGTVGVVAKQLGRSFIGVELKSEYCEMARKNIGEWLV